MSKKHTLEELNELSHEELVTVILTMQGQLDALNEAENGDNAVDRRTAVIL